MIIIYVLAGLLIISYLSLISGFIFGWAKIPLIPLTGNNCISVTVIIAFRNEESNIISLLESLKHQDYPSDYWDVLFINDHSTDSSVRILKSGTEDFDNGRLLDLPAGFSGKKSALEYGARNTNAELLVFTDADCLPGEKWISSIVSGYIKNMPVLISAPVIMDYGPSLFSKFQAIEFISLVGAGAASFGLGNPIMLNGANMAVRRDIYIENFPEMKTGVSSGDDIFMLLGLKKKYPGRCTFLKSKDAIVRTFPMPDMKTFFHQRIRWVSKARFYRDIKLITTAIIIYLYSLMLLITFISGIFSPGFLIIFGSLFIIKSIVDYFFLRKIAEITGQRELMKYFVISQAVYFLYAGIIGLIGNFVSYRWKERKISS